MPNVATTLGMLVAPGLLYALIPVGIVVLGILTFEVAMAITISTLPRSRMQQRWTPQEHRRVVRIFCAVFCFWPISATLIIAHVYLPLTVALIADAIVLALIALGVRWLGRTNRERKLILAGHCEQCFYDLRASLTNDNCPECGVGLDDHPSKLRRTNKSDVTSAA